jgi:hypothetical protein
VAGSSVRIAVITDVRANLPAPRAALRVILAEGCTLEAAEAVCASPELPAEEVLDRLQVLVDSSLVRRLDAAGDEPRFGLLETIREYALEQLATRGEAVDRRRQHAAFFLAHAEAAEPELCGARQRPWLDGLDRELDNLRAALAWAQATGELELGVRLAVALAIFWEERGHVREGRDWLETLLRGHWPNATRRRTWRRCGRARWPSPPGWPSCRVTTSQPRRWLSRAGLVGSNSSRWATAPWRSTRSRMWPAMTATWRARRRCSGESGRVSGSGGHLGSAAMLSWLGTQRRVPGDLDTATALLEESLRLYQTSGAIGGTAYVQLHLGGVARARHAAARAQALFEQSLAAYQSLGDRADVAYATGALAGLAADAGELARADAV